MPIPFDVGIKHRDFVPDDILREVIDPLEASGAEVHVKKRGPEFFAGFEWLVPTAIVIILSRKYVETITQEAAKDHYELLKAVLTKLLRRTVGRDNEINIQYLTSESSPAKQSESRPGALSMWFETHSGLLIRFVTEDSIAPEQRERCIQAAFALIKDYYSSYPQDALTRAIESANIGASGSFLMRFDPNGEQWYLWQPSIGPGH